MSAAGAEGQVEVRAEVDLVNAALLGTDRRAVPVTPGADPAGWLLDAAGRRRASALVAGASTVVRRPEPGPPAGRPAPAAARAIVDELLLQASSAVLDLWLREAVAAGCCLAPEHWTPVLDRARRSTELDRGRLGAALGARGLWFARQNPAWSAVVRAAEASSATDDTLTEGRAREAVAALAAGEQTVGGARALGHRVGSRLPLPAYADLAEAGRSPANASARAGLAAAEEALWVRWALAQAFDPARTPPERRTIPPIPTSQERP